MFLSARRPGQKSVRVSISWIMLLKSFSAHMCTPGNHSVDTQQGFEPCKQAFQPANKSLSISHSKGPDSSRPHPDADAAPQPHRAEHLVPAGLRPSLASETINVPTPPGNSPAVLSSYPSILLLICPFCTCQVMCAQRMPLFGYCLDGFDSVATGCVPEYPRALYQHFLSFHPRLTPYHPGKVQILRLFTCSGHGTLPGMSQFLT